MSSQAFKEFVLQQFFRDLHKVEQDNYSAKRYSFDGIDRSATFDVGRHVMFLDWFMTNCDAVYTAFTRLTDQTSREIFASVLRYRLSGHLHVRIQSGIAARAHEAPRFQQAFAGVPSPLATTGMFGKLVHYDAEWENVRYTIDTLKDGLLINLVYRQYFYNREGVVIEPRLGDHVIDGGACTGDTAVIFRGAVGGAGRIYAFDPVQTHLDICHYNFARPGYENVVALPFGLGERNVDAPLAQVTDYLPGYRPSPTDAPIPLRRIDELVMDGTIERIDFLKLDVEGAEMPALRGALSSIHRFRPRLAISIYHKPNDFFEIINFIHDLNLGYRIYLDHYTIYDEETVVYAEC